MSEKIWSDDAWEDYLYWQSQNKKTLKRINQLIKDIECNGCKHGHYDDKQHSNLNNKPSPETSIK